MGWPLAPRNHGGARDGNALPLRLGDAPARSGAGRPAGQPHLPSIANCTGTAWFLVGKTGAAIGEIDGVPSAATALLGA